MNAKLIILTLLMMFSNTMLIAQTIDINSKVKYDNTGKFLIPNQNKLESNFNSPLFKWDPSIWVSVDQMRSEIFVHFFNLNKGMQNSTPKLKNDPYSTQKENVIYKLNQLDNMIGNQWNKVWTEFPLEVNYVSYDVNKKTAKITCKMKNTTGASDFHYLNLKSFLNSTNIWINNYLNIVIDNIKIDVNSARKYDIVNNKGKILIDYATYPGWDDKKGIKYFICLTKVTWLINGNVLYTNFLQ